MTWNERSLGLAMTPENRPEPATEDTPPPPVNQDSSADTSEAEAAERTRHRLRLLPPEVGAVLVTVGVAGLILPGPFGTPFLLAGGLILAPRYFHRMELWAQKRFPEMHRTGRRHVDRF